MEKTKQKINFGQFLGELIVFQYNFLENNFNRMIILADEYRALTEQDRERFLDKAYELIIVDIMMSCSRHFSENLTDKELGEAISIVYGKYLLELKHVSKILVEQKLNKVMGFFELVAKKEEYMQKRVDHESSMGTDNEFNKEKFYLCQAFREYCVGENTKAENWEGKAFATFKFAKAFVNSDIVTTLLNDYSVVFD